MGLRGLIGLRGCWVDFAGLGLVGFVEEAGWWGEGEGGGVVFFSEGEMEAVGEEFTGELGFATEAVDDPRLGGTPLFFQGYYFGEGFDYVEDKGFAEGFAQDVVIAEECGLGLDYF